MSHRTEPDAEPRIRNCSICGEQIEPGDVATQVNGAAHHWECPEIEGVPA